MIDKKYTSVTIAAVMCDSKIQTLQPYLKVQID